MVQLFSVSIWSIRWWCDVAWLVLCDRSEFKCIINIILCDLDRWNIELSTIYMMFIQPALLLNARRSYRKHNIWRVRFVFTGALYFDFIGIKHGRWNWTTREHRSCHKQSEAERSSSHNIASITLTLKSSLLSIRQAITEPFCYRRHPALVITFIHSFHVIYLFISLFVYESFARCLWSSVSHHCFCLVYIMSVVCICNAI